MKARAVLIIPSLERKFFFQPDLGNVGIAALEAQDVLHAAAPPLIDRLVVVTDHANLGAQAVQELDDFFLDGVDVLVFVDNHVAKAFLEAPVQGLVFAQGVDRLLHDGGIVKIAFSLQ
jgi:hypothetical protein